MSSEFRTNYQSDSFKGEFFIHDSADLKYAIDTLNLRADYLDAMWRIYCSSCDKPVNYAPGAKQQCGLPDSLTFGELSLDLFSIDKEPGDPPSPFYDLTPLVKSQYGLWFIFKYRHASCQIFKNPHGCSDFEDQVAVFYTPEYPVLPVSSSRGGVARQIFFRYWFYPYTAGIIKKRKTTSRVLLPEQPEVIIYIRTHADRIDPWFRKEAEARGIFDSLKYPPATILREMQHNKKENSKFPQEKI